MADDSIFDPGSAVWYCNDPAIGYQSNGSKPLHTDSIYSVIFGKWMDQHGAAGYNYIFTFLMITGIIGAVLAFTIYRLGKKNREQAI